MAFPAVAVFLDPKRRRPPISSALSPAGFALHSPSFLKAGRPQIESSKSAGRRPDPPQPHLVEMGRTGRETPGDVSNSVLQNKGALRMMVFMLPWIMLVR
ncbi:hypothetical protein VPH35_036420 [Triticum aestivum]